MNLKLPSDPITPTEAAEARQVHRNRILALLRQGRIPGAVQLGNSHWLMPRNFTVSEPPKRKARQLQKL